MDKLLIANRIKELREASGLTQAELAKALELKQVTISQYESGRIQLTLDKAIQIAGVLKCDLNTLVGVQTSEVSGAHVYAKTFERLAPLFSIGLFDPIFHDVQFSIIQDPYILVELGLNEVKRRSPLFETLTKGLSASEKKSFYIELLKYLQSTIISDKVTEEEELLFFNYVKSVLPPDVKAEYSQISKIDGLYFGKKDATIFSNQTLKRFTIWLMTILAVVDYELHELEVGYIDQVAEHIGLSAKDAKFIRNKVEAAFSKRIKIKN